MATVKHTQAWESTEDVPKSRSFLAVVFGFAFGWIWFRLIRDEGGSANSRRFESIIVRIPQCVFCSSKPIEQIAASIEDNALKLVVHREFVQEFERVNGFSST